MDNTSLIILIVVLLILFGGGWRLFLDTTVKNLLRHKNTKRTGPSCGKGHTPDSTRTQRRSPCRPAAGQEFLRPDALGMENVLCPQNHR